MTAEPAPGQDIADRIVTAINKLAIAMRSGAWQRSGGRGLHPTQAQVVSILASRPQGLRVGQLAAEIGITPATVSDSIAALAQKGLVTKRPAPGDARAVTVRLTGEGRQEADGLRSWPEAMVDAVHDLDENEQTVLLQVLVKMIRRLQDQEVISAARMCVTCQYFDPYAHAGTDRPHHCRLVDAPLASRDLRIDCPDHLAAGPDEQQIVWQRFCAGDRRNPT